MGIPAGATRLTLLELTIADLLELPETMQNVTVRLVKATQDDRAG